MESLPCKGCKGLCCGPVPITEEEFHQIKKKLKSMPEKLKLDLKKQIRFSGTCIFYDQEKDRCGIHSARPGVCRAFGYYKNLICFRKSEVAINDNWSPKDKSIGLLSIDIKWDDFS